MKEMLKHYRVLIVFVAITFLGLGIGYFSDSNSWLWKFWQTLDVAFAVALGIMAFLAYKEFIHSEDEIKIYFDVEGREIETGLSLLRKDCSRGEILGILGMIQQKSEKRFSIQTRRVPALLKEIQEIQRGNENTIIVEMSQEEFEQYDLDELGIFMQEKPHDN